MTSLRKSLVAVVSAVALGSVALSVSPSFADDAAPCATQQTQLDRATAKLEALTIKFAEHPTKHNEKAKKAQVQRVDRAQGRLDACLAGTADPADD